MSRAHEQYMKEVHWLYTQEADCQKKEIKQLQAANARLEKMLELQYKGKIGSKFGFASDGNTPRYWPSVNGTCWSRKSYDTPHAALEAAMTEWEKMNKKEEHDGSDE